MINNPKYSAKLQKSNMFGLNTIGALVADYTGNLTFIYNQFAKWFIDEKISDTVKDKHDAETMIYTWILNEKLLTREEINKEDITPMVMLVYGFSRHCSKTRSTQVISVEKKCTVVLFFLPFEFIDQQLTKHHLGA